MGEGLFMGAKATQRQMCCQSPPQRGWQLKKLETWNTQCCHRAAQQFVELSRYFPWSLVLLVSSIGCLCFLLVVTPYLRVTFSRLIAYGKKRPGKTGQWQGWQGPPEDILSRLLPVLRSFLAILHLPALPQNVLLFCISVNILF